MEAQEKGYLSLHGIVAFHEDQFVFVSSSVQGDVIVRTIGGGKIVV